LFIVTPLVTLALGAFTRLGHMMVTASRGLQKAYQDHAREVGILHERLNTANEQKKALADQVRAVLTFIVQ